MDFEADMGIPSIPMVLAEFYDQEIEKINDEGMPGLRIQWIRGPVWGKTSEQLRRDVVNGTSPISGKNIMREIVDHLTRPLTDEDKKTGTIEERVQVPPFCNHDDLGIVFEVRRPVSFELLDAQRR